MATALTAPHGYTLILPPGWTRVPLREGAETAVDGILARTFSDHPADVLLPERRALRTHLLKLTSSAAANSGLDLYLPTALSHGFTVAASFVVAELSFGSVENPDPGLVLARTLSRQSASAVTVGGTAAARSDSLEAADPARDVPFASRRVDYALPVPGDADRWLVVTFSTIGQGDPQDEFAGLLVDLFDAIMTTFRWTT